MLVPFIIVLNPLYMCSIYLFEQLFKFENYYLEKCNVTIIYFISTQNTSEKYSGLNLMKNLVIVTKAIP